MTALKHITYSSESTQFPVAVLIKEYLVDSSPDKIKQYYVDPLVSQGVPIEDIIVIGLPYTTYKDVKASTMNEALPHLQEYLDKVGVVHCLIADTKYLKKMTGKTNVQNLAGILIGSRTGSQRLFKARVYTTYVFDDKAAQRVQMSIEALAESYHGTYAEADFMVEEYYPKPEEIPAWLTFLSNQPKITCDIEAFGLRLDDAGVGTIGFCWKEGCAVSFSVDYLVEGTVGKPNWPIRNLLRDFFTQYKGICIYHNVSYDVKQIIANCFMRNNLLDYESMIEGVLLMTANHRCTKDISYLATNSAAGNDLSLKHLTLEYTGVYAIDVKDITKHPIQTVLEYNNKDCAATWWLYQKMYPIMVSRNQEKLYLETFQPNQRMLINMELTGMPLDMDEVIKLRNLLNTSSATLLDRMRSLEAVEKYIEWKAVLAHQKYQNSVKGDGRTLENYKEWKKDELIFKPTSDPALVWILHEYYCLPVIDKTLKAREPSVAGDTLKKHIEWIKAGNGNPEAADFIKDVIEFLEIDKINGTFVKAFITKSIKKGDGVYYLHGSFNQGGTLSGRLSSSDPNLQNIPSGSKWGKAIKRCFKPGPGWLMVASDYAALEARIAAMRTNDPVMRSVFTDGFDSHSRNTYAYATGQESWYKYIKDPTKPEYINLIKSGVGMALDEATLANADRSASKPTTFALQFLGNYRTLMNNQGYSEEKSKRLYDSYHKLYKVYFDKLTQITEQAAKDGYVEVAYGLRIDCPALKKSISNTSVTPSTVEAEIRSICNAVCQSYGMINSIAARQFMDRVWSSKWRGKIHMQALIHDAIYLFIPMSIEAIEWVNINLIECMVDQTEPNIQGSDVHLEAELDIHPESWATTLTLSNNISQTAIKEVIQKYLAKSKS